MTSRCGGAARRIGVTAAACAAWTLVANAAVAGETIDAVGAATAITPELVDRAVFREWVPQLGEQALHGGIPGDADPLRILWTASTRPQWQGISFGDNGPAGVRHLRIGFTMPVAAGTILTRGVVVAALRDDAVYPGDLGDDRQWVRPLRVVGRTLSLQPPDDPERLAIWVLPPGTKTRALRLSTDSTRPAAAWGGVGNVVVWPHRYLDLRFGAVASASRAPEAAARVIDDVIDAESGWNNAATDGDAQVSDRHPEAVVVRWPWLRRPDALALVLPTFGRCEVQVPVEPRTPPSSPVGDAGWRTLVTARTQALFPLPLAVNVIPITGAVATTALRLRITAPQDLQGLFDRYHDEAVAGRRVGLVELIPLHDLGDAPLEAAGADAP